MTKPLLLKQDKVNYAVSEREDRVTGPTEVFSAFKTYEKQLRIEKTRLSHQVWSHGGSTFKKKMTLNGHFSRPAETDPYVYAESPLCLFTQLIVLSELPRYWLNNVSGIGP